MPISHSPRKYAPIFTSIAQPLKRKSSDSDANSSALNGSSTTDHKRLCTDLNMSDSLVNIDDTNLNSHTTPEGSLTNDEISKISHTDNTTTSDGEVGPAEVTMAMIFKAITSLTERIDGMESKIIAKVDAKLQYFEKKAQDSEKKMETRLRQLEDDIYNNIDKLDTELEDRMSELENARSSTTSEATEARIDQLERLARANELVISGVPRTENENVSKICDSICEAIGYNGSNIIQTCFRVPFKSNNRPSSNNSNCQRTPSIIIKFCSTDAKIAFFKSYIAKKNLCVTNIGFSTPGRIYINENFTKKNFDIYRLAKQMKADGKIFQYHTFSGRISVILNENSRQIGIGSKEQLNSLISDNTARQPRIQRNIRNQNQQDNNNQQQFSQERNNRRVNQRKNQQPKHHLNNQANQLPNQQLRQQHNHQPNQQYQANQQQSNQQLNH